MKLFGVIAVHVRGEEVMRDPRFLERLRRAFGGKPDLRSGRVRASIEATAIVESVRDAMRRLAITNAVSLVIDDTVLFEDRESKPDDLGDLFLTFHDNASVFGSGFDELRLAMEHREGDLHVVLEVQARSEHPRNTAAVRVVISGRIDALAPRPGEDAETYRARAEPVARNRDALELYRLQFASLVDRVRDTLATSMPTARVEVETAEPRVVHPSSEPPRAQPPDAPTYDPYDAFYPSSLGLVTNLVMWSALFSMATPPHVTVTDSANHVVGTTDNPGIEHAATTSTAEADDSSWWEDTSGATDADEVATDTGGGWWNDDALGGGDFGGGDFGGFD